LQSRDDAQDVVHALFTDLLQRADTSAEALDLPWPYRAVTNGCLTFLRDARNRERLL
jgi:DNA-directed RNA polymerase specialized sigma24 family protein